MMQKKSGQVFSLDMIFSIIIFIMIVTFAVFFLLGGREDFSEKAYSVAEYLAMHKFGYENEWYYDKIQNFSSMSYGNMRKTVGVSEEFYFKIFNNSAVILEGGSEPAGKDVASIRRLGLLRNEIVFLDVMLWK